MTRRQPPHWPPATDRIAKESGITTVTYSRPIAEHTPCHYCGKDADSRDHVVPDSVYGVRFWWNLVPSCFECNNSKADRQACSCMFCLRAIALWGLGYRSTGTTRGVKERARVQRRKEELMNDDDTDAIGDLYINRADDER